jgi:hypothetical protein
MHNTVRWSLLLQIDTHAVCAGVCGLMFMGEDGHSQGLLARANLQEAYSDLQALQCR